MADDGLRNMDETSQQAVQEVKETAAKPVKKAANELASRAGKKVGKLARKGAKKAAKVAQKAAKTAIKAVVHAVKTVVSMVANAIAVAAPYLIPILIVVLLVVVIVVVVYEERGSTESNDLEPSVQNPVSVNEENGLTTAVAMTEPQAVIDAYYKYMSIQSFTKEYNNKLYDFADEDETTDFSALRDYYDKENNFYLSDDFIRMVDETLHQNELYFPEQVIKPVYGERLNLVNKNGEAVSAYTALLPSDYATGEKSQMFADNFDDPEKVLVKDFDQMVTDRSQLDHTDIATANDDTPSLIAKSQAPREYTSTDSEDAGATVYELKERNVIDGSGADATEVGLWDYGFGSVLQYEPHQKNQYITCSYTDVDVDVHERHRTWIEATEEEEAHWSDWSEWSHSTVYSQSLDGITNLTDLESAINSHLASIDASTATTEYEYDYNLPTSISSILSDTTTWNTSAEPNAANEAELNRSFSNSHIDMKIEGAKDIEISRLEFSDELDEFSNHGTTLYPLKIALISHAATFSGNINYTITPAGEDGCEETRTALQANTTPTSDHRQPVKTITVAGGCGEVELTATRDGEVVTQTPKVEETDSPWGFAYIQQYADNYCAYAPADYMNDRDFFLRTGMTALQQQKNGSTEEEYSENANQYLDNLEFLINLGLLRLYSGGTLNAMGTVDIADMNDETSDLYILAKTIAAEAANDKLDELLVGAVFYNRVKGDNGFPDTYWEVLTDPGQYACYPNGRWAAANPTQEEIASAMQVMTGQFALPANVIGQSQEIQGVIFMQNGVHYYCTGYDGVPASATDVWGRPAKSPDELKALADSLEGIDPNEISGEAINFDLSTAIFIGDSLTVGLNNTENMTESGAAVIAETGAGLDRIKELVSKSADSLWEGRDTVYLLAGTNSSGLYEDSFKEKYTDLLDEINRRAPSGITIVITSLPPVVDGAGHSTSNALINNCNKWIQEIAKSRGFPIIDIWSNLQDDGSLREEYDSGDGLHLNAAGYNIWYNMIRSGASSTVIGTTGNIQSSTNGTTSIEDIESNYRLYDIEGFDILNAINLQAHLSTEDETARNWLENLGALIIDGGEAVIDVIGSFFDAMGNLIFQSDNKNLEKCFYVAAPYNMQDIEGIVYSTITFTSQVSYSAAEAAAGEQMENGDITFLFVGKDAVLGLGTQGYGNVAQLIPGVGTTINGLISPTDTYYSPSVNYNGSYVELAVPEGTTILAVGDGTISSTDSVGDATSPIGKNVVQTIILPDGRTMVVTYGFLDTVDVSPGANVSAGDKIGTSGKNASGTASLYFSVKIDGEFVDPMSIFYQSSLVYGGGSLGKNLNNADGTVNMAALEQLREELNQLVGLQPGDGYSPSDFNPAGKMPYLTAPMNELQPLQCTWWARARGLQYVMTFYPNKITYTEFNNSNHGNGGDVYSNAQAAGLFNTGTVPKPNSLVSFYSSTSAGHVAYVEAVDYVNKVYYISEAGSGDYWGSVVLTPCKFGEPGEIALWHYRLKGFVYLDEIRK